MKKKIKSSVGRASYLLDVTGTTDAKLNLNLNKCFFRLIFKVYTLKGA